MIMNLTERGSRSEFYRLIGWARECVQMRIIDFPIFQCYLRSDVYSSRYTANQCYYARAHMAHSNLARKLLRKKQRHWIVEFNDLFDESYDVEMVLYHELAHFLTWTINKSSPSHGLLWAASCDAIQIQMDMDEDSLAEGTHWISQVDQAEFEATLKSEKLGNFDEWEEVRQSSQLCIRKALSGSSTHIHFEDMCDIVARYYYGRL